MMSQKTIAIMQPYFLPYIGYWQLIQLVDAFVIYDEIQYTKKGWINRNRFLQNGKDALFSIPLKADSDHLNVVNRFLTDDFDRLKLIRKLREAYRKAPFFEKNFSFFEDIILYEETNLFRYILNSIQKIMTALEIHTPLIISSNLNLSDFKGQEKVIEICKKTNATHYINPIGGLDLYDPRTFAEHDIELNFLRARPKPYVQFSNNFIPFLSILDVLMFNDISDAQKLLHEFDWVKK